MNAPLLILYDDALARNFAPFSLTRPLCAVRSGAEVIGARWASAFGAPALAFSSSPHLAGFQEFGGPRAASGVLPAGTIIANARCVPALSAMAGEADVWRAGADIAAVRLRTTMASDAFAAGTRTLDSLVQTDARESSLPGRWLRYAWDIIAHLPEQLADDVATLATRGRPASAEAMPRIGTHPVVIEDGAVLEPFVTLDTTGGGIVIKKAAHIESFTRIAGPCVIGEHTHVFGGRVNGSAIGEHCRIHGDLSASVFFGHGNKAHEGFVGHSVVGRWANLGAGTTTSNLKNSYGAVKAWSPAGERGTGLTFLGSLIGDHAKLGIGTMLGTGTVVGAGANVFGTVRPPKRVPPFAWGDAPPYERFSLDKFLEVAERVMKRRDVSLLDTDRALLARAHSLVATSEW